MAIVDKESLSYSLVDNNQGNGWFLGTLVVHLIDDLLELSDLFLDDLPSHSVSDSISVDDEVIRKQLLRVSILVGLNCLFQSFSQVVVNDLLALLLENLVTVVLRE
jgi:hypothetical protein